MGGLPVQESLHLREKEFYVPDLTASFPFFFSPSIPNISAFNYTWSVCQPSSDGLKSIKNQNTSMFSTDVSIICLMYYL